ncbi:MAG: type VI secretion system protein TssA [Acidobacteria bacterium]|nr:MAG: type VI secretion system protein TssA [Acidobacteriota bacterium]
MPLPEGLLHPIPGENPSGQNLRYDPVYDKIREARRAEEELQLSEEASKKDVWARAIKKADFVQVLKLSTEALSKRTKDLQIAAWLTEALLVQEKIAGLTQGINLIRGLLENFWDTLYPEIEDGDLEMRFGPIEWVGARLDTQVRRVPLTKNKLDWFKFQESRRIGYEADAQGNDAKMAARQAAIEEKKCTGEEFDEAARNTGESYYRQLTADLAAAVESVNALETLCDEKFGREAPNFANLKKALEDLQDTVREFWKPAEEKGPEGEVATAEAEAVFSNQGVTAAAAPARKRAVASEEPADSEDAVRRMVALARYFRVANAANPVPYMVLRGLRWGELRANGPSLDGALLEPPPSETRQTLKKLALEGQWSELLEGAEAAMSLPCGRGWLDLQRYTVRACEGLGYEAVAAAVRAGLRSLLGDYPDLASASLSDDTPAANNETQAWIRESILLPPPTSPEPEIVVTPPAVGIAAVAGNGSASPDVLQLAQQAAREGRIQDAVELLSREIAQERSGRARFQRTVQLAALFLSTKHERIAYPILAELADEIDRRKLEEWEESSALAHPLALLFRCMDKLGHDDAAKQKIYQKICRLDPVQVLSGMR